MANSFVRFVAWRRVLATLCGAMVMLAPTSSVRAERAAPSFDEVRAGWRGSDAVLLDRHGASLARLRVDATVRRLDWVRLEDVSPALRAALVASEDRRFWEHDGVDWVAAAGAAARTATGGKPRGASTLTMQLAGLVDARVGPRAGGRDMRRKVEQAWLAMRMERRWTKAQILEAWLNLAPFRGDLVGVDAMSRALFGKRPDGLDGLESALAVALVRSPAASPDVVARRACAVLRLREPQASCTPLAGLAERALAQRAVPLAADERLAPHVARRLLTGPSGARPGASVRSTLDARLQRLAIDSMSRHLSALGGRAVEDAAVVVLDNATGEVLAWVGASSRSAAPEVDHALAPRQAGSTLKPFVYALAIESQRLTAASILDDAPLVLAAGAGLYVPQNYDRGFRGPVTLRTALGASLNVPAVRALQSVGPDALLERLRLLGIDGLAATGEFYGPSLALGSADVSLAALANAYRALANGGVATPYRLVAASPVAGANPSSAKGPPAASTPPESRRAFSAPAAFIVADILSDRAARAATFGLDNALATRRWSAVKTGTSKDMRDNWCVGFTTRHTIGVWVGNASGAPMHDVSGVSGAAPIWADLVRALSQDASAHDAPPAPSPPPGLVRAQVRFADGLAPARAEWFLAGTEVGEVRLAPAASAAPAIVAPVSGTILALDPDMPPAVQRVVIEGAGEGAARAAWRVGGVAVGRGARVDWMPRPGQHLIEMSIDGKLVGTSAVEVRGAALRPEARSR